MSLRSKKTNTKENLLESAAVLFSKKGYTNTSVAEICELANANIASVNYHFRSKEALYRDVLLSTFEQAQTLYPIELETEKSIEGKLYQVILSLFKRILSKETKGNFYKLVAKEMAEPTAASGSIINEIVSTQRARMHQLITEIYAIPADEELLFRMTHSIFSQCLFFGLHEKGRSHHLKRPPLDFKDAESLARHVTDFSLAGIKCYRNVPERKK
jgi:AcrR family transcriptional regulator